MDVITAVDVLDVQAYIFASNRLRDAVAGSWLVYWATAVDGALQGYETATVMASGGNALLRFGSLETARTFAAKYTRLLYQHAPGLAVVIVHREIKECFACEVEALQIDLARAKCERVPTVPQLGLSVTERCQITGLPAIDMDNFGVPLSSMMIRRRHNDIRNKAEARWTAMLPSGYDFPREIDQMGRTEGDTSLLGVVYVDGNGIGERIRAWLNTSLTKHPDEIIAEMGEWSTQLDRVVAGALRRVIEQVIAAADHESECMTSSNGQSFGLRKDASTGDTLLPIRPLLMGGDDLTFICDGRIALSLAETALQAFSERILHLGPEPISGCAGVAIVPLHTPFDRAYALAVSLCAHAKLHRRASTQYAQESWLDWHIGTPRPGESVTNLRDHSYTIPSYILTGRPYRLGQDAQETLSWRWFSQTVLGTDGFRGAPWAQSRNALHDLRTGVREGPTGVQRVCSGWAKTLKLPQGLDEHAFSGDRTPILDAVELLDIHFPLAAKVTS